MRRWIQVLCVATAFGVARAETPAAPPVGPAVLRVSAGVVSGELRPGSSCEPYGEELPFLMGVDVKQKGTSLVQPFMVGCGCPTGPVFTAVFEPLTSPLQVRFCAGPGDDVCEMACRGELTWDFGDAMAAAGAKKIEISPAR